MLRLDHVAMRYGQGPLVLHDINLTLGRGDFVLVTGPTGAGKIFLLHLLGLVHPPTSGDLTFSGQEVRQDGPARAGRAAPLSRRPA